MNSPSLKNQLSLSSPLVHRVSTWWAWWTEELGGLLPGSLRSALLPSVERLYLKTESNQLLVSTSDSMIDDDSNGFALPPQEIPEDQRRALDKLVSSSREIILLLPTNKVLVKPLTLPLVTESNLREVLGFEMDRQTPFSLDQVYYDYVVNKRDTRAGVIDIELYVTPRAQLDELLSNLAQTGIHPHRALVQSQASGRLPGINLIPETARPAPRNSARHLNLALALIALCLLAASVALPLMKKMQHIEALEAEVELKTRKAGIIQRLNKEIEQLDSAASFLVERKRATPLTLDIINELTRILPDNTWVNNLSIKGKEVQIQGFSTTAAALIPLIDASEHFHNPRFRSSVTSSKDSEEERFHLSMEITGRNAQ